MKGRTFARCEVCQGKGWIRGIFQRMECAGCNGAAFIDAATNLPLEYSEIVAEQRTRLEAADKQIKQMLARTYTSTGPSSDYAGRNNRHHRGGGNWTGD